MAKWVKCEKCGKSFGKTDIRNGICVICSDGDASRDESAQAATTDAKRQESSSDEYRSREPSEGRPQNQPDSSVLESSIDPPEKPRRRLTGEEASNSNYKPDSPQPPNILKSLNNLKYFASNAQAIEFLEVINFLILLFGLAIGFLVFLVGVIVNDSLGFYGFLLGLAIAFAAAVGWSITRVFIGIAQDVRVSRDNSEALVELAKAAMNDNREI